MILVVDYGIGNIPSVLNMLKRVGANAIATSKPDDILAAEKLILPGVGAFDTGMKCLRESGLIDLLNHEVMVKNKEIMGICLGAQMLGRSSEEGREPGLGWIPMDAKHFGARGGLKIPNMGWRHVAVSADHSLVNHLGKDTRYYFVHSYHMVVDDPRSILLTANYGGHFTAGVVNKNISGFQFHPEKSHRFGMQLFKNFVEQGHA